jgi:hypothetical protein
VTAVLISGLLTWRFLARCALNPVDGSLAAQQRSGYAFAINLPKPETNPILRLESCFEGKRALSTLFLCVSPHVCDKLLTSFLASFPTNSPTPPAETSASFPGSFSPRLPSLSFAKLVTNPQPVASPVGRGPSQDEPAMFRPRPQRWFAESISLGKQYTTALSPDLEIRCSPCENSSLSMSLEENERLNVAERSQLCACGLPVREANANHQSNLTEIKNRNISSPDPSLLAGKTLLNSSPSIHSERERVLGKSGRVGLGEDAERAPRASLTVLEVASLAIAELEIDCLSCAEGLLAVAKIITRVHVCQVSKSYWAHLTQVRLRVTAVQFVASTKMHDSIGFCCRFLILLYIHVLI